MCYPSLIDTFWSLSYRADPRSRQIADRHYNRQKIGAPQFVPPGRCMVLRHDDDALWVTSFPIADYVQHAWAGAWMNSLFRNETSFPDSTSPPALSSDIIREAVAITISYTLETPSWNQEIPTLGMVSFVDPGKIRHKRDPGRCYTKAGFSHVGYTRKGLYAFQLLPSQFPDPLPVPPTSCPWLPPDPTTRIYPPIYPTETAA